MVLAHYFCSGAKKLKYLFQHSLKCLWSLFKYLLSVCFPYLCGVMVIKGKLLELLSALMICRMGKAWLPLVHCLHCSQS